MLKPALDAGQGDRVGVLVEGLIRQQMLLPSGRALLIACGLMIVAHLLWLARGRTVFLVRHPDADGQLGYDRTARSLVVLAVCVALLLVAPRLTADPALLARSSIAAVGAVDRGQVPHYDEVFGAIQGQQQDLGILQGVSAAGVELGVGESLWSTLAGRLDGHDASVRSLDNRLNATAGDLGGQLAAAAVDLEDVASEVVDVDQRLAALQQRIDALDASLRGLLPGVSAARESVDAMGNRLETFDNRLAGVEGRMTAGEGQLDGLRSGLDAAGSALAALDARLVELDGRFGGMGQLLDGVREQSTLLSQTLERLQAMHARTGLLVVSGTPGVTFQVRETGVAGEIPAVMELPPGRYTLVATVANLAPNLSNDDVALTRLQLPSLTLQAEVRADQATGVTFPFIGRVP